MRVLIIEDEIHAAERLQQLLQQLNPNLEVISVLESISETVAWFHEHSAPDMAFFDIHLADGLSFDIFRKAQVECPVVFTTAYDQYALKAFEVNSLDYLLKPIDVKDLERALGKFEKQYSKPPVFDYSALTKLMSQPGNTYKERFLVTKGSSLIPVSVADIAYICTDNGLVYLHTHGKDKYLINYKLEELEQMLNPRQFFRANRQFITSNASIQKVHPYFNSKLKIEVAPNYPTEIIVSRLKASEFKTWLGE